MVIQSPIAKDFIKIPIPGTTEHEMKPKLLLQCSVRELHNDLVKNPADGGCAAAQPNGKIIVSDTALHYMMPPQVRKFSNKHKIMCGCEVCITDNSVHTSLLAWRIQVATKLQKQAENAGNCRSAGALQQRFQSYRDQIMVNGEHKYPKARQAAYAMMCPCPNTEDNLPNWKCVLGCCIEYPSMIKPAKEVRN